jgi:hypothetical protein
MMPGFGFTAQLYKILIGLLRDAVLSHELRMTETKEWKYFKHI